MRFKPPEGRAPVCQRAVAHEGVKMDACSDARVLPAPASVGLASVSVVPVGGGVVLLSAAPPSTVATGARDDQTRGDDGGDGDDVRHEQTATKSHRPRVVRARAGST